MRGGGLPIRIVLSMTLALSAACAEDGPTLVWEVDLADPSLGEELRAVEGTIHRGGCDGRTGDPLYRTVRKLDATGSPMPVPQLEPGTYAFAARGRDDACVWYASGCETIELPQSDGETVQVRLDAIEPERACPWESCVGSRCVDREDPIEDPCGADVEAGAGCGSDDTVQRLGVCRRTEPVELDGDPVELLDAVPIRIEKGDLSATYRVQWDCDALYVGAIVTDLELRASDVSPQDLYETDSVEVMVDVALDRGDAPQADDRHVVVNVEERIREELGDGTSWSTDVTIDAMHGIRVEGEPDDPVADVGWRIELAIPWEGLGVTECPEVGRVMGLDLAVNDERASFELRTVDWAGLNNYRNPDEWNCIQLLDVGGAP